LKPQGIAGFCIIREDEHNLPVVQEFPKAVQGLEPLSGIGQKDIDMEITIPMHLLESSLQSLKMLIVFRFKASLNLLQGLLKAPPFVSRVNVCIDDHVFPGRSRLRVLP
jgi:hypothetical protein